MDLTFRYAQTPEHLQEAYAHLKESCTLALDTEFVRCRTYDPRLALIQVATEDSVWLLDPLMPDFDWLGIRSLLSRPGVTKIIHAPQQDLEALQTQHVILAGPFWDTQTASMFCGQTQALGYETLVREHLERHIDKAEQRSIWDHRPLTEAQLLYAAQDVVHLHDLVRALHHHLEIWGRLDWFQEDMRFLEKSPFYGANKVFGLKPSWLTAYPALESFYHIVQRLFDLRETHARTRNIPREFMWDNAILMKLAEWAWSTEDRTTPPSFASKTLKRLWPEIDLIFQDLPCTKALSVHHSRSALKKHHAFKEKHEVLFEKLRSFLQKQAQEHQMPVALIATRDELKRFVYGEDDVRFLEGWRYPLLGETAQKWRAQL